MPSLSCLRDTLAFCLLFATPALGQQSTFTAERYPYDVIQTAGEERWLTGRVVDGITGRPIGGAEMLLIDERDNPIRGEFDFAMRTTSDADGFVRIRVDEQAPGYERWYWVCVRAEGYGPRMEMDAFDDAIVRLAPAVTVPIEVLDWLDRPVPDALVGFCGGCGHTCDLVSGRTNPGGIVRLPGMDLHSGIADFYVEHPDLGLGYKSVDWWPGQWPARLRVDAGVSALGVVVDANGKPIANAYVGQKEVHRGPWTRTAGDGSFHLHGCSQPEELWVQIGSRELLFDRPTTVPFRLQVPAEVVEGVQSVGLPPDEQQRRDRADGEQPATVESRPSAVVRTVGLPPGSEVKLRTRRSERSIDDEVGNGTPIALPAEPFAFVLQDEDYRTRVFPVDRKRARAIAGGVIRLPWYRPTQVEGRVTEANGDPLEVQIALVHPSHKYSPDEELDWQVVSGAISLTTQSEGQHLLLIKDNEWNRPLRMVPVMLPRRGDNAFVDIGTIVMTNEPQLALLQPNGEAIGQGSVTLLRTGWHDIAEGYTYPIDQDGHCWLPDLRAGDAVLVRSISAAVKPDGRIKVVDLPSRFVLEGNGPWRLQQHGGELLLEVATATKAKQIAVTIGDRLLQLGGPTLLRGLAPGRHQLFLAADGHQSATAEATVPNRGFGELSVTLPQR